MINHAVKIFKLKIHESKLYKVYSDKSIST